MQKHANMQKLTFFSFFFAKKRKQSSFWLKIVPLPENFHAGDRENFLLQSTLTPLENVVPPLMPL